MRLNVSHVGLGMLLSELPFSSDMTLATLKEKLYPKTGTEVAYMKLCVNGRELVDEVATL